ncbi:hypothetical protein RclHR1_05730006 [Rhizophagus clarus]|uniref:Carbon catabolite repression protein CreD n=1 Tax=Rhizophagus clarus TaxID=94130 RepID=A0A2Z6S5W4_9GLOM|nr:hypothetical protein RclHR1_05730006 [Rhizophagus clarus]GET02446.1 carbon catabolite repression protein CreD [Rhizophagus clarus]
MVHFKSTPLFQIRLDDDTLIMRGSKTESVGCVLRGQLVLVITEQTKFKEIRLTFQGKSKVAWVDGVGKGQYHHSEEKIIFQHDWVFLPAGKQYHVLNPDNYHWDFELILPGTLPESIEGCPHGNLRYSLKAVAERNTFALNLRTKRFISIMRSILPSSMEYLQAVVISNTWGDKAEYEFSAGAKIFCLGDKIPISVNLKSLDPDLKVRNIICIFKEYATYSIGSNQKTDVKEVKSISYSDFSTEVDTWDFSMELSIPNEFSHCLYDSENDVIRVRHKLKFFVILRNYKTGLNYELRASLPIIITLNNDSLNLPPYIEAYLSDDDIFENTFSRCGSSASSFSSSSSPCCSFDESLITFEEMNKLPSYRSITSSIPIPLADSSLPPTYDDFIYSH